MSNIDWNQLFNTFNNFANGLSRGIIGRPSVYNPTPSPAADSLFQKNNQETMEQLFPKTTAQLEKTTAELELIDRKQTNQMLKDLLKFPKNFDNLVEQLAVKPQTTNQQTALMLLASSMDMSKLASLLQNNSKDAMSNLYQLLAQYSQVGISIKEDQIAQITKLVSLVSSSSASDAQSMRTIMLMYLPWLPLNDPNAFKFDIAKKSSDGGEDCIDTVSILIKTENFGNLKADILKTEEDGIRINLTTSETFPQKDFELLMKEESKKNNININVTFSKKESFNRKIEEELKKTQVCMNTSPGVNPFLIIISSAVIRHVHFIDSKDSIRELRKERIDNGKGQN